MKRETIEALLALNRAFYERAAPSFSESRRAPWPGWSRLLDRFDAPISVLDLGCGNGRFFAELQRRGLLRDYLGVDTSSALLALARAAHPNARFLEADATSLAPTERFDLVVAFGLLHHLPSFELRARFLASLQGLLEAGGIACVTFWQFADRPRFQERMIPWTEEDAEPGDCLLSFGDEGARYCHHTSDEEILRLIAASGLKAIDRYRSDGESGDLNAYVLLAG